MYKYSLMAICLLIANLLQAQQIERCGHDLLMQQYETKFPGFNQVRNNTYEQAREFIYSNNAKSANSADSILRIPVVVHFVYKNATENLHDSLVHNQIEMLNQSFRMTDPDTINVRAEFDTIRADAHIEFFLARLDENGDSTTGITRTETASQGFFDIGDLDKIKKIADGGVSAWNTSKFLNIWVGDLSFGGQPGVLGFAYPPLGGVDSIWPAEANASSPELDGVVIHYEVFGVANPLAVGGTLSIADRGRTVVHEVGHYLGLRHIWGDGGNPFLPGPPDCTVDDGLEDTPNAGNNSQQTGCLASKNTCSPASGYDYPDMWENYMDYSVESCQVVFTNDQVAVMRYNLFNPRAGVAKEGKKQYGEEEKEEPVDTVGIAQNSMDFELQIFPNPSDGNFNIQFAKLNESTSLSLIGLDAKVLMNQTLAEGSNRTALNLSHLPAGMYFVRLQNNSGSNYQRIILR